MQLNLFAKILASSENIFSARLGLIQQHYDMLVSIFVFKRKMSFKEFVCCRCLVGKEIAVEEFSQRPWGNQIANNI